MTDSTSSGKGKKGKINKHDYDQLKVTLQTQIRVAEQLEEERDHANDEYEFALARLHTVQRHHQKLSHAASEMGRERDRAVAELDILRQQMTQGTQEESTSSTPSDEKSPGEHVRLSLRLSEDSSTTGVCVCVCECVCVCVCECVCVCVCVCGWVGGCVHASVRVCV